MLGSTVNPTTLSSCLFSCLFSLRQKRNQGPDRPTDRPMENNYILPWFPRTVNCVASSLPNWQTVVRWRPLAVDAFGRWPTRAPSNGHFHTNPLNARVMTVRIGGATIEAASLISVIGSTLGIWCQCTRWCSIRDVRWNHIETMISDHLSSIAHA